MAPRWWPWQHRTQWVLGQDLPEAYVRLSTLTNVYDPYKKKAIFLFFLGMGVIGMLDIPGLFFTNPYTHLVEGPAAYLGILGAIAVGLLGLLGLWGYQYYKDYEVMQFTFGAFNLRVRKNFRVAFHAMIGTIERVPNELAEELKAVLDKRVEELRQLTKVQPITVQDYKQAKDTPTTPNVPVASQQGQAALVGTRREDLHLFWLPLPGLPVPGVALLSSASWPEELTCPLPGEWIWEGWIRHAKGEVFDLAVAGEWQFKQQATGEIVTVPICTAAGTYYDFTWGLERALKPPTIDASTMEWAKNNVSARVVGLEAVKTLQVYRDADEVRRSLEPTIREQVTDMVGGILELLQLEGKIEPREVKAQTRWGLYVGVAIMAATFLGLGWLATHGWHL